MGIIELFKAKDALKLANRSFGPRNDLTSIS